MVRLRASPLCGRPWAFGFSVVCALAALAVATIDTAVGLTALGVVGVAACFRRPAVRIAGLIAGDVILLHRDGLVGAKAIYLAAVVAVIVAALPTARAVLADSTRRAERRLLAASAAVALLVPVSLAVGQVNGVGLVDSTRDAVVYLLLAAASLLAVDLRTASGPRWPRWALLTTGLVCWLSFIIVWVQLRGYVALPFGRVLLPSLYLPAALFAYATANVMRRENAWRWSALAGLVAAGIAFTGSRTFLLLLLAPLAQLALRRERRKWLWPIAAAAIVVFALGVLLARVGPSSGPVHRLASVTTFVAHPGRDPSWQERTRETSGALRTWRQEPILGSGAGHRFHWQNFEGQARSSFLIDSSASYLAKFGVLGLLLGFVFAAGFVPLLRSGLQDAEFSVGAEALIGFAVLAAGGLFLGVPMEDKGFPVGVLLLLALALPGAPEAPVPKQILRRRAFALAAMAAAACAAAAAADVRSTASSPSGPTYADIRPGVKQIQAFERALVRRDGKSACGLLTDARRARTTNCVQRLSRVAAGSEAFKGSVVILDRPELDERIRYLVVRRPSKAEAHYMLLRQGGHWRIGDLWPLGPVGVQKRWREPLIVGRRDVAVRAVEAVGGLLWKRSPHAACRALDPALAKRLGSGCAALLRQRIGYGPSVYGAFVVSEEAVGHGKKRVLIERIEGGRRTAYTVDVLGAPRISALRAAS